MLTTDDPNYIVYASPIDHNLGDEKHTEFYLSLKYPLVDDWFSDLQKNFSSSGGQPGRFLNSITPDRLLLQYNGLYDFYAIESDRYDSAPINSRRQTSMASGGRLMVPYGRTILSRLTRNSTW